MLVRSTVDRSMPTPARRADSMQVTVVVPLYNKQDTILRCLDSIGRQTKPAARIIVVDDCSTDQSLAVLSEASLKNIHVINLDVNRGPGAARNVGVANATTDWVAFIDADDEWETTFLEQVCRAIAQFDASFGSSGGTRAVLVRGAEPPRSIVRLLHGVPREARDLSATFWRVALHFVPINSSSAVVNRAAFDAVGGFPEDSRRMEDVSLWMALWQRGRFVFVNKPLSFSYIEAGGLSSGPLHYSDILSFLRRSVRSLWRSLSMRTPGTRWFAIYVARMVVLLHASYVSRRIKRLVGW